MTLESTVTKGDVNVDVNTDAILALPTVDKLQLMELLWENLGPSTVPVPEWVEQEAARRRDEMLTNSSLGAGHDETWAKIAKRNV